MLELALANLVNAAADYVPKNLHADTLQYLSETMGGMNVTAIASLGLGGLSGLTSNAVAGQTAMDAAPQAAPGAGRQNGPGITA